MRLEAYGMSVKGLDHAENEDAFLIDKAKGVFAVADGVTIPYGGKEASNLAIELVRKHINPKSFEESLNKINEIFARKREEKEVVGFTTLTVLCIKNNEAKVANIGDSPAFLIRGNEVREIYISDRTPFGIRAMDGYTKFHITKVDVMPNDMFCLCTDGISDYLSKKELLKLVKKYENLELVVKEIIEHVRAKPQPYNDDKTIVVVKVWE